MFNQWFGVIQFSPRQQSSSVFSTVAKTRSDANLQTASGNLALRHCARLDQRTCNASGREVSVVEETDVARVLGAECTPDFEINRGPDKGGVSIDEDDLGATSVLATEREFDGGRRLVGMVFGIDRDPRRTDDFGRFGRAAGVEPMVADEFVAFERRIFEEDFADGDSQRRPIVDAFEISAGSSVEVSR